MADKITVSAPTLTAFKGNPVLTLNPAGRVNLGFGLAKGMLIVENLPEVIAFLVSHGKNIQAADGLADATKALLKQAGYDPSSAPNPK